MMAAEVTSKSGDWLSTGREYFAAMLLEIDAARYSICFETYYFSHLGVGQRFRDALVGACRRGVRVQVLLDAFGSYGLPADFWRELESSGGKVRLFNPLSLSRLSIRDHRKLLICDNRVAFVGGFNIAPEYDGDGVTSGWCDVGLKLHGELIAQLASNFEEMFARADFKQKPLAPFRKSHAKKTLAAPHEKLLLSGPGRGRSPIKHALQADLKHARSVRMMVAYFLPTWRLRRGLARAARSGASVQLILAGKSDVAVSRLAAQSLYRRLLKAGVEIYEYQPQILHAKLFIFDNVVYVGSANLDQRSLSLNYELMLRFENKSMAGEAREIFRRNLVRCRGISFDEWRVSRSFWERLKQRWAYLLLVRLDPYIARRQWRSLLD